MKEKVCPFCKHIIRYSDEYIPYGAKYEICCTNCDCRIMFKKIDMEEGEKKNE